MPKRKLNEITKDCYIVCESNEQLMVIVEMLENEGYELRMPIYKSETIIYKVGGIFCSIDKVREKDIMAYPASDFLPDGEDKHPELKNITTVMAEYIRAGKSFSYDAGTGTLTLKTEQ